MVARGVLHRVAMALWVAGLVACQGGGSGFDPDVGIDTGPGDIGASADVDPREGQVGGPCFPNGTCFPGLVCETGACRGLPDSAWGPESSAWIVLDGLPEDAEAGTVRVTILPRSGGKQTADHPVRGFTLVELVLTEVSEVRVFVRAGGGTSEDDGYWAVATDFAPGEQRVVGGWGRRSVAPTGAVGALHPGDAAPAMPLVVGRVVRDGAGIVGAWVTSDAWCGAVRCTTTTASDGSFQLATLSGTQRITAEDDTGASAETEVNAAGERTEIGDLVLGAPAHSTAPWPIVVVDEASGAPIPGAEIYRADGILLMVADGSGRAVVPFEERAIYAWSSGYQESRTTMLLPTRRTSSDDEETRVLLRRWPSACEALIGDWRAVQWQRVEEWYRVFDPDAGEWSSVAEADAMRVRLDGERIGWGEVDIGGPFRPIAGGYWFRCSVLPSGALSLFFHPLNRIVSYNAWNGGAYTFLPPGEWPPLDPVFRTNVRGPRLHHAWPLESGGWIGAGHPHLGRWKFGTGTTSPAECEGVPEVHEGDLVVGDVPSDDQDVRLLNCVREVRGDLILGYHLPIGNGFTLEKLERVQGDFRASGDSCGMDGGVRLPRLARVGGELTVGNCDFDSEALERVGSLRIMGGLGPRPRMVVNLPKLVEVEGGVEITSGRSDFVGEFNASQFARVGADLLVSHWSVNCPELSSVVGRLTINNHGNVAFPALAEVGGTLEYDVNAWPGEEGQEHTPRLDLPELSRIGGALYMVGTGSGAGVAQLHMPILREAGEIDITSGRLRVLNLSALEAVAGTVNVYLAGSVEEILLPSLERAEDVVIGNNAVLRTLRMPSLREADYISIKFNPALTELQLGDLAVCGYLDVVGNVALCASSVPSPTSCRDGVSNRNNRDDC